MSNDTAKIRLKMGQLEVEYEGKPSFLQDGLFNLLEKMIGFYTEHKAAIPAEPPPAQTNDAGSTGSTGELDHSTNTIATILGAKTGSDLVVAASARLTLVQGKDRFSRKELRTEMQTAASFHKATYNNNLSKYLDGLIKADRLRLVGKDSYAISANEKKTLEAKLAQ